MALSRKALEVVTRTPPSAGIPLGTTRPRSSRLLARCPGQDVHHTARLWQTILTVGNSVKHTELKPVPLSFPLIGPLLTAFLTQSDLYIFEGNLHVPHNQLLTSNVLWSLRLFCKGQFSYFHHVGQSPLLRSDAFIEATY